MTPAKKTSTPAEEAQDGPLTGVFVATEPLAVDGALAFAPGDFVPAGHVTRFGWRDKVRAYDDKEED